MNVKEYNKLLGTMSDRVLLLSEAHRDLLLTTASLIRGLEPRAAGAIYLMFITVFEELESNENFTMH